MSETSKKYFKDYVVLDERTSALKDSSYNAENAGQLHPKISVEIVW